MSYDNSPEKRREYQRARYAAKRDELLAYKREYDAQRTPEQKAAKAAKRREWQLANRDRVREDKKRRRAEHYERALALKVERGCRDCGDKHPAVLDFHHEGDKETEVALMIGHVGWDRLEVEIMKCVVLCSNCHRKLHWEQKQLKVS